MRIYELSIPDGSPQLTVVSDDQFTLLRRLRAGSPWRDPWPAHPVVRMRVRGVPRNKPMPEFTEADGFPAVTPRVRALLEPLLGDGAQWLPIQFDEGPEYWLLNVLNVEGALDLERSEVLSHPTVVRRFAFHPEAIQGRWLFKTAFAPVSVLASEAMRALFAEQQVSGAHFSAVWDSEIDPFPLYPTVPEMVARPEVFGPEGFVTGYSDAWPPEWRAQASASRKRT